MLLYLIFLNPRGEKFCNYKKVQKSSISVCARIECKLHANKQCSPIFDILLKLNTENFCLFCVSLLVIRIAEKLLNFYFPIMSIDIYAIFSSLIRKCKNYLLLFKSYKFLQVFLLWLIFISAGSAYYFMFYF